MKFKFQWINKIVEKLPEELKEKRKAEIGSCFIGTKKQLDEKVRKSLYEQVKIISVATIIFLIVLFLTIIFYFSQDRRILITRDETGGEVTEQQIRIKTKSDDDIYTLEIHPKGYTKAQITQAFDRGEAYLRKHLVAKNKSLNEVERNLEMPVKIPGENIAVQWQSDDPTVIDEEGNVFSKNVKKDYLLNLDARMECQGEVRILKIPVCVVPGNSGKKVSEKQKIIADLKKLEEKHITKEQFYLPDVIRQGRLLPAENESQIPAILFLGIAVIIFFWYHENEKYKEQRIQTLEQSMVEYPQIIEHLILFLGTGMSVVAALEAVATEYEKEQRRGNKKEMLAKRIALLLGNSDLDIQNIYAKVKSIYVDRSDAVHDGITTNITRNSLDELRNLIRDIGRKYIVHIQNALTSNQNLTFVEAKNDMINNLMHQVTSKIAAGVLPQ